MYKAIGKKTIRLLFILTSLGVYSADNEVYIDQSGATSNIDIEQVNGSGNIIGGADAVAGTMTPLDLDGGSLTLDILQKGSSNKFLGDIWADSYTGYFSFIGDSNTFNMSTDETNTYGADSSNVNVQVTGSSNTMTLNHAMVALADTLDLDWTIQGSSNSITAGIDVDGATNYMDIDGSDNTVTYDGDGYAGGYFYLDHTGGSRTFNIDQESTLDNDWLKIISNGSSGTVCVTQSDSTTSFVC
tara:strand:+ start:482 stop:1210 length:729 start_codon:yes stop_codon:yes gene_type:complete